MKLYRVSHRRLPKRAMRHLLVLKRAVAAAAVARMRSRAMMKTIRYSDVIIIAFSDVIRIAFSYVTII